MHLPLPNYFLADLPPEAELGPGMVAEACLSLKRNRARHLASRSVASILEALAHLSREWLNPSFPIRKHVLAHGPAETGFSEPTLLWGIESFFRAITYESLEGLIIQDLGSLRALDDFVDTGDFAKDRSAMAIGPELFAHFAAGNLPNPAWMTLILGFILRSGQFMKCAAGASFLPRMFAHALREVDAKLGSCIEIAAWPGGDVRLETALFEQCDAVTATGSDEAVTAIRNKLSPNVLFAGYGSRASFGYVASSMLSSAHARVVAQRIAEDVAAWDQAGCLSPHLVYVESGGILSAELFSEMIAEELAALEIARPRGPLAVEESAAIASRRGVYELRAAASAETKMWASKGSSAWTVVFEADARFQLSCLNRFLYVKSVRNLEEALQSADSLRGQVSSVGLAATAKDAAHLAKALARWGVTRVCQLGSMQRPSVLWRHDGRPALGSLVRWADYESSPAE